MDAAVFAQGMGLWRVSASPSMRGLGEVLKREDKTLRIMPNEGSDVEGISAGPYASLYEAMAAMGAFLDSRCGLARTKRRP